MKGERRETYQKSIFGLANVKKSTETGIFWARERKEMKGERKETYQN